MDSSGFEQTLGESGRLSGIALHTGVRAHLTLKPAPAGSGITIVRTDLADRPGGPALAANVVDCRRATTLRCGTAVVHTAEHVLAALRGCGVDNAVIEMDGPEPPIVDGSAQAYVRLIEEAGIRPQERPRRLLRITRPVAVELGESCLVILPADCFRITCTVQFGTSEMGCQHLALPVDVETFRTELAGARTFCGYHEIEALMVAGLIRGGSLDNAVILKDGATISKDGLRFPDELVRHKMLDLVGDLSLVGRAVLGHVVAIKPGHRINVECARAIARDYAEELADG